MEIIEIQGFIGQDAKSKETNGVQYTYFNVAVTKKFKKSDGTLKEKTNWYAVFKPVSKLDQYLKKGVAVFVRGDFSADISEYEGKKTIAYSINNPKIYFSLGNRKAGETTNEAATETDENKTDLQPNVNFEGHNPDISKIQPDSDDLPF